MNASSQSKANIGEGVASPNVQAFVSRVNDAYRAALVNLKYYGHKLKWAKRHNLSIEIAIAVSTATGVSGWAIWATTPGQRIWQLVAGVSAVLAALKPVLPLSKNIATYSKLHAGHLTYFLALKDLAERIAFEQGFSRDMEREFADITKRYRQLIAQEAIDEPVPSGKHFREFEQQAQNEKPVADLGLPFKG